MKYGILLLLSLLMLSSCGDDEKELNVAFNLEYDNQPLVMFQEYEFGEAGGFPVEFSRISFYVSDVQVTIDGQKELFREVDYIDLTESHSTLEKAEEGFIYNIGNTEGEATDISFNFGLTAAQNATVPADYPSSSALSRTSEYWSGWESYVMIKFEGNIDLDRDGVKEKGIALHLGTDNVMRSTSGAYSEDLSIAIDVQKIFNCGEVFDIETTSQIHNLSQIDKAEQLADNIACGLEYVN